MAEQSSNILHRVRVFADHIELTFKVTLKTSSIQNTAFLFTSHDATPVDVNFKPINTVEHYDSISRVLLIYYATEPTPGDYTLSIEGLKLANESIVPSEYINLLYPYDAPESAPFEPVDMVDIQDNSIRREAFISTQTLRVANPYFHVTDTDPESNATYIEDDYKRGRISITFSDRPSPQFLNSQYIKFQKKDITKIGRWETVPINISMDSHFPTIYIYIPSLDATPVYNTEGSDYFEENFKYRIRLSKEIGV